MRLKLIACFTLIGCSSLIFSWLVCANAQELKKVKIGYPAFSLTFLTFFVAKDAGIFKKHGLDVELIQLAGAVPKSALGAGGNGHLTRIIRPLVAPPPG